MTPLDQSLILDYRVLCDDQPTLVFIHGKCLVAKGSKNVQDLVYILTCRNFWCQCMHWLFNIIGASLSEPHTSESNGGIFIYILYICRTSFRKCKLTLLTWNIVHAGFKCGWNIKMNTWSKYYSTVLLSRPLLLSGFYLHCFGLPSLLPMDAHTSSRRALKLAHAGTRSHWRLETAWKWETDLDSAATERLRNKGAQGFSRNVV